MRRLFVVLALNAGLAGVAPVALAREAAPAPTPTPPPAAAPAKPAADDPNRVVCTREHVVGSNRPVKVCMTVAQRDALKDSASRTMDPTRRTAGDPNPPGAAGM